MLSNINISQIDINKLEELPNLEDDFYKYFAIRKSEKAFFGIPESGLDEEELSTRGLVIGVGIIESTTEEHD